jgi:AhpD family alkylhydroperoxidase
MTTRFTSHTPESAVGKASDLLGGIVARNGSAGPMVRTMAGSPSVLGGYLELSRAMKRSRLDRAVSERISLAVQARLGCEVCIAAHTSGARDAGVSDEEIELAKQGTSSDPTIAPLVELARRVDRQPAAVTAEHIEELRHLGYRDRDILDVVGLVSLNVLTGAFNLVAGLEPETLVATA